jgi:hypothetical protein
MDFENECMSEHRVSRKHLMEAGPSILNDIKRLIQSGVESLTIKLAAVAAVIPPTDDGDAIYLTRIAETWSYFYTTTLVFLQAVFLPVNQPFSVVSLPKGLMGLSVLHGIPYTETKTDRLDLDIRKLGLISFKDDFIWPIRERLEELLLSGKRYESLLPLPKSDKIPALPEAGKSSAAASAEDKARDTAGRIIQMLSVLCSMTDNDFEREYLMEMLKTFHQAHQHYVY